MSKQQKTISTSTEGFFKYKLEELEYAKDPVNNLRKFIWLYPEKEEDFFSFLIKNIDLLKKITNLPDDLEKFFLLIFENKEEKIRLKFLKKTYPNLSPLLFVPEQDAANCGLNALSAITKFFSKKEKNPLLYVPIKKTTKDKSLDLEERTLKRLGETCGIEEPGAIFSLKTFRDLIHKTGFCGEVLHINEKMSFSETIKKSIDSNIPIIIPCDLKNKNGNSPHYGVIVGYIYIEKKLNFLLSENGKFRFFDEDYLFSNNSSLKLFSGRKLIKKYKVSRYRTASSKLEKGYKEVVYPSYNLEDTLKNRLLIVYPESSKDELASYISYITQFIESDPKKEIKLSEPDWDFLYPKSQTKLGDNNKNSGQKLFCESSKIPSPEAEINETTEIPSI